MQRVGAPHAVGDLRRLTAAFCALRALHSFDAVHGDARLPNLLDMGGEELAWIDLRTAAPTSDKGLLALKRHDAHTLARSALGLAGGAPLPAAVVAALEGWGEDGCAEEAARAVWGGGGGRLRSARMGVRTKGGRAHCHHHRRAPLPSRPRPCALPRLARRGPPPPARLARR
jgi:hypothetical protein